MASHAPSGSTIVAVATGPSAGGVGVVRISGPAALAVGRRLAPGVPEAPQPRHAYLARFVDGAGEVLDRGLFLYFQAPHSFTGEDVVELQAHGAPRLLELLVRRALEDDSARLAAPGEFTRRAFLNGQLDLAQAEAVATLVQADSEAAVRAAAAQARGWLSEEVRAFRAALLELQADLEASLSFPDEAQGAEEDASRRLQALHQRLQTLVATAARGALWRRGARVVLCGPPNAGKSTLFNALVGTPRALVDAAPGTTRDVLEAKVEWGGLSLTLVDTAGVRAAPQTRVEEMGIARAREAAGAADLVLWVLPPEMRTEEGSRLMPSSAAPALWLLSQCDRVSPTARAPERLPVSGHTGEGVDALRGEVLRRLVGEGTAEAVRSVSSRHADALRRAAEGLERAVTAAAVSTLEAVAGEVALSMEALGEVTGETASDALLDAIFQRFCIGK